ncbi:MAG: glycosyltransferase [Planctomycetota bacterium]|jgi:dolichol-phosphate mannosyltransferase
MSSGKPVSEHNVAQRCEPRLGIVCPMANEKATAVEFVQSVLEQCPGFAEVTFFAVLDNACKDGTVDLLRELAGSEPQLRVIWAPENTCVVDAYMRGYKEALAADCDWILEIDAGFSHQPQEIPQFFQKMAEGHDCVFGSRFCKGGQFTDAPLSRYFISWAGSVVSNLLLGTKLKDMTSGFELFSRSALEHVLARGVKARGHFFQTEIKFHCRNFAMAEVPIHYRTPSQNVSAGVLWDSFRNLFRLFTMRLTGRS